MATDGHAGLFHQRVERVSHLEHLLAAYPHQHLVLVMDNASYHRSRTTQAALSLYEDRLLVVWLPKYSPFLNPIERFGLLLKQLTVASRLHRSLDDLQASVDAFLHTQPNVWHHPDRLLFADNFRLVA